jgi:hypothetical protein
MDTTLIKRRIIMNKRTKKALALAAAVASLGASLGVAQSAENRESNEIKGGNTGTVGPTDSNHIKWYDSQGSSKQIKGSNSVKVDTIKSSNQSKGATYIKFDGKGSR